MFIRKVNYQVESYLSDVKLTENDVKKYYYSLGYISIKDYSKKIQKKELFITEEIYKLFLIYSSGYPDLLLFNEKYKEYTFVEIKLDNDNLRSNQIEFIEHLSKIANVKVCYFNKDYEIGIQDKGYSKDNIDIIKQYNELRQIQKKKRYNEYWVVRMLYERYNDQIKNKEILGHWSSDLGLTKAKVLNYIINVLNKEVKKEQSETEVKKILFENVVLNDLEKKKLDKIRRKKVKLIARKYNGDSKKIHSFYEENKSLTYEEIEEKLNTIE